MSAIVPAAKLQGILLAGGYGRGEGGVLRTVDGDKPYNDLEFYVFIGGNAILAERKFRHPLHELGERLSPSAGLEVEFKVLTLGKLRRSRPSMFYYDLLEGHRWVLGGDGLLTGCEHHRNPAAIPLHEATRLLFNRCCGLLFSRERLLRSTFGPEEADFVGRNLAKAQLALGDVLLAAHGEYHWSCRERHQRLLQSAHFKDSLDWAEPLKALHAEAIEFKLHPQRSTKSRDSLTAELALVSDLGQKLWLWLESKRLGIQVQTPRDYAFRTENKCPETAPLRNRLLNVRAFGLRGMAAPRYPRERLFNALALLLWDKEALLDPRLLAKTQGELNTSARDLPGLVSAYLKLWNRFN